MHAKEISKPPAESATSNTSDVDAVEWRHILVICTRCKFNTWNWGQTCACHCCMKPQWCHKSCRCHVGTVACNTTAVDCWGAPHDRGTLQRGQCKQWRSRCTKPKKNANLTQMVVVVLVYGPDSLLWSQSYQFQLMPSSITQIHPLSTVEEQPAASSGKATQPVQSKLMPPTKNCAMCAEERIAILKQSRSNPQLLINSDIKIYSACRHRPHFDKHAKQTNHSTDESNQWQKS